MRKHRFRALRMVLGRPYAAAAWRAQHHRAAQPTASPGAQSGGMVRQLIDDRIDEPSELNFGNRPKTLRREPDRQPGDRGFGERGIDHALQPEPFEKAV